MFSSLVWLASFCPVHVHVTFIQPVQLTCATKKKRNWNPMGNKPLTACQRDWHIWHRTDDIAFACKECSRAVGKATRADLTRLKRIGRYLRHTTRAVWEFPLQQEESIVLMDSPMLTLLVVRERGARHLEDACALVNTPWQLGRQYRKLCH